MREYVPVACAACGEIFAGWRRDPEEIILSTESGGCSCGGTTFDVLG
jgi:hypothetical protein